MMIRFRPRCGPEKNTLVSVDYVQTDCSRNQDYALGNTTSD